MAQITSSVGIISGIDTGAIINDLISIDSEPVTLLQTQISSANAQKQAYSTLETSLNDMQSIGNTLTLPQTFQNATTTSSDPNTLTATAAVGAAVGSYQLQVARLVSTQQSISQGFADATSAPVGAGTITLEEGGGQASSQTPLSALNGGAGVSRGQFRITDGSGNSAVIDTSDDVDLDDVVTQINTAQGISVHALVSDGGLVLTDTSGKNVDELSVQDLSGGTAAADLGIAGTATDGVLTGKTINYISASTALSQLNDGNGITTTTAGQNDFTVTTADGSTINVSLSGAKTVGDLLNDINTAGGSKLTASIDSAGTGIQLTDNTTGSSTFSVTADNGSQAAAELGLTSAASGNVISGRPVIAGLDSVLTSSLFGGSGLSLGTINITDRDNHGGAINLSSATSVSDIINLINNNTQGADVTASLNASGSGIQITDNSGGTGNLVISNGSADTASELGIAGTFTTATQTVTGANLQHQYVSANTLLSTYDGGSGVDLGEFQINNSIGGSSTIDLSQGTFNTVGDVIQAINAKNIGVTASINANGNGILLTDTSGGSGKLTVTNVGGDTTASDLNIAGTATGTTIDGGLEKTITVTSSDTLTTLQNKINALGFGVTATIINDGTAGTPYRLSLTATNSGQAGSMLIDSGTTNLNVRNLVSGQDAAVFFGGGNGDQPLLITSSTNTIGNVINGVNISLLGASSTPVTLSVTQDSSNVVTQLTNFVSDFNTVVGQINTDSQYNTTTNTGGILLGDATADQVSESLYGLLNTNVEGAGQYTSLADIGITIDANSGTNGATLTFDQDTFNAAIANDPTAVQNLFSQVTTGLGTAIANTVDSLTDPVSGVITVENNTLDTEVEQYQSSIDELNAILADKRQQLETQFANMESTLASLESQGSILDSLASIKPASSTSSTAAVGSSADSSSSSSSASTGSSSSS